MTTETEQPPQLAYFTNPNKTNRCCDCVNLCSGKRCFVVKGPTDGTGVKIHDPRKCRCDGYIDHDGNRINGIN